MNKFCFKKKSFLFAKQICIQFSSYSSKQMIFFLPGLGADERLFKYQNFNKNLKIVKQEIKYTLPSGKDFYDYSNTLYNEQIKPKLEENVPYHLCGVSLGTFISHYLSEISEIKPKSLILIGGKKNFNKNFHFNVFKVLNLLHLTINSSEWANYSIH